MYNLLILAKFAHFFGGGGCNFSPFISKSFQMWDHLFPSPPPQGFQISKNCGHPTLGRGDKRTIKRYLKSEHTDAHKHRQTKIWTNWLIESIGPEGRCFVNANLTERNSFEFFVVFSDYNIKSANITQSDVESFFAHIPLEKHQSSNFYSSSLNIYS